MLGSPYFLFFLQKGLWYRKTPRSNQFISTFLPNTTTQQQRLASSVVLGIETSAIKTILPMVFCTILSHPFTLLLFQAFISTQVLLSTPPSCVLRWIGLLLLLACAWLTVPTYLERLERIPWTAFAAGHTILGVLQYIELALLRQWDSQTSAQCISSRRQRGKPGDDASGFSFAEKLKMGYFVATSSRHITTSIESKGIPDFSSHNPTYIPSWKKLLFQRAAICFLSYVVLDLAALGLRSQHARNASSRPLNQVPILTRLDDVSLQELNTRIQDTVGYYVFCYFLIQCYTSALACIALSLKIDTVESWKPNFGPLKESYSLRQFWG